MTCAKCSSKMYQSSLNYESNGMDNQSVLYETFFYKCPICGHHHFLQPPSRKMSFIPGQKIKGVPIDVA